MVTAVEVLIYGLVELSAACEAFASREFEIRPALILLAPIALKCLVEQEQEHDVKGYLY